MRLRVLIPTLTAGLLLFGGCGSPEGDPSIGQRSGAAAERQDAVPHEQRTTRWTNEYCSAIAGLVDAISVAPKVDPSTPQRASETSIQMLSGVIDGLDGIVRKLDDLEPSPVPGGDDVAGTAIGTFIGILDRARVAQSSLSAAPAGSEQSRRALEVTGAVLDEVGEVDLLGGLQSIPQLAESGRRAPACRGLTRTEPSPRMGGGPAGARAY